MKLHVVPGTLCSPNKKGKSKFSKGSLFLLYTKYINGYSVLHQRSCFYSIYFIIDENERFA